MKWLAAGLVAAMLVLVAGVVGLAGAAGLTGSSDPTSLNPSSVPAEYAQAISDAAASCDGVPAPVLAAQLAQESGWNPHAVSPAGAEGLAQFLPATWAPHGVDGDHDGTADIWNPIDAIWTAARYDCQLKTAVAGMPGDPVALTLAAYHAGVAAVLAARGIPPGPATRAYVAAILAAAPRYQTTTGSSVPVADQQRVIRLLTFAFQQIGKPYLWGSAGPASFDCSGLTSAAYATVGVTLPHSSREQWNTGPHPTVAQLQAGDLVFWAYDTSDPATIHHVALWLGDNRILAAPHTGAVVQVQPMYWTGYIGAVRPG